MMFCLQSIKGQLIKGLIVKISDEIVKEGKWKKTELQLQKESLQWLGVVGGGWGS